MTEKWQKTKQKNAVNSYTFVKCSLINLKKAKEEKRRRGGGASWVSPGRNSRILMPPQSRPYFVDPLTSPQWRYLEESLPHMIEKSMSNVKKHNK